MSRNPAAALRSVARRVRGRLRGRPLILLYHRVAAPERDPQALCVRPERFAEHVELLGRVASPLPLARLAAGARDGSLPRRAVAVTFDDGYVDNHERAAPILRRFGVPATVFVASGYVGTDRGFWWDDLERLLLAGNDVPEALELRVGDRTHRWELAANGAGSAAGGSARASGPDGRPWNVTDAFDPTPRHAAYRDLFGLLRPLEPARRREALEVLREWRGPIDADGEARCMREEEMGRLAADGLVEIGAHTVNHPFLSALPEDQQEDEIRRSRDELEDMLGRPVTSFAYPFGSRRSYGEETVRLVREAGFARACSNFPGSVGPDADPHQLPRHLVRDWDADTLARFLWEWFGA